VTKFLHRRQLMKVIGLKKLFKLSILSYLWLSIYRSLFIHVEQAIVKHLIGLYIELGAALLRSLV